jgi:hypothetical protein
MVRGIDISVFVNALAYRCLLPSTLIELIATQLTIATNQYHDERNMRSNLIAHGD